MKKMLFVLLLISGSFVLAQDNGGGGSKDSKGNVTMTGCVGRSNGDYVLTQSDPGVTYELQATGKTRLKNYLGQRVEITGSKEATLSSSSDATGKMGSAAPVTLRISSIKTLDKNCSERDVSR
jgi:hypothetical protein